MFRKESDKDVFNILLFNVDKTKVMASDGIVCCILIQSEPMKQVIPWIDRPT